MKPQLILIALVAGSYGIPVHDHLSNRRVLRIKKMDGTAKKKVKKMEDESSLKRELAEDESFWKRELVDVLNDEDESFFKRELRRSYVRRGEHRDLKPVYRELADLLKDEDSLFFDRELTKSQGNGCCPKVSPNKACRIRMIDNLNNNDVILEVKESGRNIFKVTDRVGSQRPWVEKVWFNRRGILETTANPSVENLTCRKLLTKYEMKDSRQLDFRTLSNYPCTKCGKAIIYFMVMEWFYFG